MWVHPAVQCGAAAAQQGPEEIGELVEPGGARGVRVGAVCRRRSKRRSVGLCGGDSPQGRGASAASGLVATGNVVCGHRGFFFLETGCTSLQGQRGAAPARTPCFYLPTPVTRNLTFNGYE